MAWDPSLPDLVGIAAALAILGVGTFVLLAKPGAWLHRLFFLLAFADGMSTLMFRLSAAFSDASNAALFAGMYWYYYIAFLGLLAAFGVLFPLPPRSPAWKVGLLSGIALLTSLALLVYALDHSAFRDARVVAGELRVTPALGGNAMNVAFVCVTALLVWKLTRDLREHASPSHRRQAALVLGGMTLAYAPYPLTVLAQVVPANGVGVFISGRGDLIAAYAAFALFALSLLASAALLMQRSRGAVASEARLVLGCYAGVLALALAATLSRDPVVGYALRGAALLAYPILLGYAIARYEVFDIDRKMRRATTVTLVAAALAVTFILAENALEGLLQQTLLGGVPSQWFAGSAAALATAGVFVPVVKASRKAASRIVPELSMDELHLRKLEIYRHSLAGALADGIMREGESKTLAALRSSLGITDAEHQALLRDVAVA